MPSKDISIIASKLRLESIQCSDSKWNLSQISLQKIVGILKNLESIKGERSNDSGFAIPAIKNEVSIKEECVIGSIYKNDSIFNPNGIMMKDSCPKLENDGIGSIRTQDLIRLLKI